MAEKTRCEICDRTFKDAEGLEINYNFNRKHMALGNKTPAEIAIFNLELGINKWLDLIKISKV